MGSFVGYKGIPIVDYTIAYGTFAMHRNGQRIFAPKGHFEKNIGWMVFFGTDVIDLFSGFIWLLYS